MKDPNKRFGGENISLIKNHPWFSTVNWQAVEKLELDPPIKPVIHDKFDLENFNKDLAKES